DIVSFIGEQHRYRIWGAATTAELIACIQSERAKETLGQTPGRVALDLVVRAYAERHGAGDSRWWVDHTPENLHQAMQLRAAYPEARFVHVVRDGRAATASVLKLDWGPHDVLTASRWWVESVAHGLAAESALGAVRVRYEDLVRDPDHALQTLCTQIGVPFSAEMAEGKGFDVPAYTQGQHRLVGGRPDSSRIDAWRSALTKREIALFERKAGGLLALLGYAPVHEATAPGPSVAERLRFGVLSRLKFVRGRRAQQRRLRVAAAS
ncbi:MAG: sulfotransferase, partial [Bacteroidota bacterium]